MRLSMRDGKTDETGEKQMHTHGLPAGPNMLTLQQERAFALNKAESIVKAAESANRSLTAGESQESDMALTAVRAIDAQIAAAAARNTVRLSRGSGGVLSSGSPGATRKSQIDYGEQKVFSAAYFDAFYEWIASGGERTSASLYEGGSSTGGYAVPINTDSRIVPLAPQEMAVRQLALVIPTTADIRIPVKGSFGTAAIKVESGASPVSFNEADPTLSQTTLNAYMIGNSETASWELLQDVSAFQQFIVDDLITAIQALEETWFVTGDGTAGPQGLLGNVGAGVTGYAANGSTLLDASYDVQGVLNGLYWPNSAWLMRRATGVMLKKLQKQANLFEPVFSNVNGQDYLHGRPVYYSGSMPAIGASTTPILFGDFAKGYVIGDRGGSGINVKFLDQIKALQGQLVILGYRRVDARVRRSEAIQSITMASS